MNQWIDWRHSLLLAERQLRGWGFRVEAWVARKSSELRSDERVRALRARLQTFVRRHGTPKNVAVAVAVIWVFNGFLYVTCGLRGCPDAAELVAYQPGGASELLDRNGRKFGDLAPVQRQVVKLAALPEHVGDAFIAVEDKRFRDHRGVDWRRIAGATIANLKAGAAAQGSSTITMQLSRNIFSDKLRASDKSLRRKIFEARVARRIERRFTKDEILELYLNHVYFGRGAYGVQAAAMSYFDKPASRLELDEAALLAAMLKAPSRYDPRNHPERAKERRNLVLGRMAAQELITPDQHERAAAHRLGVIREGDRFAGEPAVGAYFAELVRDQVERQFGERVYREKLKIYTTLDRTAQRGVEEELERQLRMVESGGYGPVRAPRHSEYDTWKPEGPQYLQGAAVFMESSTGDVIALVGGRNFKHSTFNRATRARRQVGSAFKPFVYAAALQEGYVPSQPIMDSPFRMVYDGGTWEPRNFDGEFSGTVSMREALVFSRNVPSVRLAAAVGEDKVARFARDAGLRGEIKDHPMIALGITEATPLEIARAYSSFAGMGQRAEPRFIQRIVDESGEVIWESDPQVSAAIKPAIAFVITDMLADAVDVGTGVGVREAGYSGPAVGKTGTTTDGADTWFVGYTPDLVGAVWIGFDQRRSLPREATGGSVAAPAWGRMVERIYRTRPQPQVWIIPETVVPRDVDPASGLVLEEGCRPKHGDPRKELFLTDDEPETICPAGEPTGQNFFEKVWDAIKALFDGDDEPLPPQESDPNLGVVRVVKRGDRDDERGPRRRAAEMRSDSDKDSDNEDKRRGKNRDSDKDSDKGKGRDKRKNDKDSH